MYFQKNVRPILISYADTFTYKIDVDYDSWRFKNKKILKLSSGINFKLDNYNSLHVIEKCIKDILKLKYFKQIIFCNIFPVTDDKSYEDSLDVWYYRLRETLKYKYIIRKDNDLYIFYI